MADDRRLRIRSLHFALSRLGVVASLESLLDRPELRTVGLAEVERVAAGYNLAVKQLDQRSGTLVPEEDCIILLEKQSQLYAIDVKWNYESKSRTFLLYDPEHGLSDSGQRPVELLDFSRAIVIQTKMSEPGSSFPSIFDTLWQDAGTLPPGEKVTYRFRVTNVGSRPLSISLIGGSCGCTSYQGPAAPIAPDDFGEIVAEVDTSRKRGPFIESIVFQTSDPSFPRGQLWLSGRASQDLTLSRSHVSWRDVRRDVSYSGAVVVYTPTTDGVAIEVSPANSGEDVQVTPSFGRIEEHPEYLSLPGPFKATKKDYFIRIDLLVKKTPSSQMGNGIVNIHVSRNGRKFILPVTYEFQMLEDYVVKPRSAIVLMNAGGSEPCQLSLHHRYGEPIVVKKVVVPTDLPVTVRWENAPEKRGAQLLITENPSASSSASLEGVVDVYLESGALVRVPVFVISDAKAHAMSSSDARR